MPTAMYDTHCIIAGDAQIGEGTRIGHFVLIRDHTVIGKGCMVGSYVDIEGDVSYLTAASSSRMKCSAARASSR